MNRRQSEDFQELLTDIMRAINIGMVALIVMGVMLLAATQS